MAEWRWRPGSASIHQGNPKDDAANCSCIGSTGWWGSGTQSGGWGGTRTAPSQDARFENWNCKIKEVHWIVVNINWCD